MSMRYLVGRPLGVYQQSDIQYAARMLAKDADSGTDAQRHRLFRLGICTPLSAGALVHVIEERDDACWCSIIEGGPVGPFWISWDDLATVGEYLRLLDERPHVRRPLPHEAIKLQARVEPAALEAADLPRKPRRAKGQRHHLSLDDAPPPEWDDIFDAEEAA